MAKQRELQSREADQAGHQVVRGKQIVNFSSGMIDILPVRFVWNSWSAEEVQQASQHSSHEAEREERAEEK